jgi:hypothetical protein
MTGSAVTFLIYLWHYVVARMLYDDLLRPLIHGDVPRLLLLGSVAVGCFLLGGWRGRRSQIRATSDRRRRPT